MNYARYTQIKKPIYCPNARVFGFAKSDASHGDFVLFGEGDFSRLGRIIGRVTRHGNGEDVPRSKKVLAVLGIDEMFGHAFIREVPACDIHEVRSPQHLQHLARWFLFGTMPTDPEEIAAAQDYGSMSNHYIARYLSSPEGALVFRETRKTERRANMTEEERASLVKENNHVL